MNYESYSTRIPFGTVEINDIKSIKEKSDAKFLIDDSKWIPDAISVSASNIFKDERLVDKNGQDRYSALYWAPLISNELLKAEDLVHEMLDLIEEFQNGEDKKDGRIRYRGSAIFDDRREAKDYTRRQQIFGEINDSDIIATRVDVVIKSESTKYCILSELKGHFLFSQLNLHELEDLIDSMQSYFASEGDVIIREGETGDVFYILEKGVCDISINGSVVQRLEDSASFGDLALMYNCPRKATVTAVTDCVLWTLDRLFFRRAMVTSSSNQNAQLAQFLSKISLFENLSERTLNQLARSLSKQTFQEGEYIIRQGEIGDRLYVISRGTVRVTITGDTGESETVLNKLSEGEIFGERALIKKEPRKANCISEGICECYYLNSQDFALMLGEIVDKLNELDEFRILRSLSLFSKLSVGRLLEVKKSMSFQIIYYGQQIACDPAMIYIVMDGCVESKFKRKYGPRGTIGDIDIKSDQLAGSLTSMTREARVGIVYRHDLINHISQQRESISTDDILSKSKLVEQEIVQSIKHDSLESEANMLTYSLRRKSTGIMLRESSRNMACDRLTDIEIIRVLGKGTFGSVYLALNTRKNVYIALKCLSKEALVKSSQYHYVRREMVAMQSFNHPFVGSYYGVLLSPRKVLFMLEYISGGELWHYIYQSASNRGTVDGTGNQAGLPVHHVSLYSSIILLALEHIHQLGYCYRDLKPENILITEKGYLKLVDFGFAKSVPFVNKSQRIQYRTFTLCGTAEYMSPEIVLTQGHDKSVDCWAYGILIYELLSGYSPFEAKSQQRTFEKIVHSQKYLVFPSGFDSHAKSLIRKLLHPNPALRLGALLNGFEDVKKQAFFTTQAINFERILNQEVRMPYIPSVNVLYDSYDENHEDYFDMNDELNAKVEDEYTEYFNSLTEIDVDEP